MMYSSLFVSPLLGYISFIVLIYVLYNQNLTNLSLALPEYLKQTLDGSLAPSHNGR